jgi:hypothetical protein
MDVPALVDGVHTTDLLLREEEGIVHSQLIWKRLLLRKQET